MCYARAIIYLSLSFLSLFYFEFWLAFKHLHNFHSFLYSVISLSHSSLHSSSLLSQEHGMVCVCFLRLWNCWSTSWSALNKITQHICIVIFASVYCIFIHSFNFFFFFVLVSLLYLSSNGNKNPLNWSDGITSNKNEKNGSKWMKKMKRIEGYIETKLLKVYTSIYTTT